VSRKIVFTNTNSDTFTADGTEFLILSIDGLGTPDTNIQQQKAPYQDGTTFIDALFDNRTITLEVAIIAPNDFATIATKRREVVNRLNPKLGIGTLVYTDESGQEWKINAIPVTSPAFPNKDYRDPFQRFQISFLCNDPHWLANAAAEEITLPTQTFSSQRTVSDVAGAGTMSGSVVKLEDDTFAVAYKITGANTVSVYASENLDVWSLKYTTPTAASYPVLFQLADASFLLVYTRVSDNYNVCRTSNDLITWSNEIVITASASISDKSIVQKSDGTLYLFYSSTSILYQTSSDGGATWAAATTVLTSSTQPFVLKILDGTYIMGYCNFQNKPTVVKSSDLVTWSAPVVVKDAATYRPSIVERPIDGSLIISYGFSSPIENKIYMQTSADGDVWGLETEVFAETNPYWNQTLNGIGEDIIIMSSNSSTGLIQYKLRSVTPVNAQNDGDVPCPVLITFTGPATNPRIIKQETLEYIRINATLSAADYFIINTAFGQKTITFVQGGIAKNGTAFLDLGSTFFQLDVGANTVYFEDDSVASTATATMEWAERFVGL